jgi:hypothetical protein
MLLMKSKTAGNAVRDQGLDISALWIDPWECKEEWNKFPWSPNRCSFGFFDLSSSWRLKTGDAFGP